MTASEAPRILTANAHGGVEPGEHHRIRWVIENMMREHRTEKEIVAVVNDMTGAATSAPNGLAEALRRCARWLRDRLRR